MIRPLMFVAVAVAVSGCVPGFVEPPPPPKNLMSPPAPFPKLKPGDDAAQKLAEAAETHNRNARKVRGLQGYIKSTRKE